MDFKQYQREYQANLRIRKKLLLTEQISAFPVENNLEMISKLKTKQNMKVPIYKQILRLKEFINKHAENTFRRFS